MNKQQAIEFVDSLKNVEFEYWKPTLVTYEVEYNKKDDNYIISNTIGTWVNAILSREELVDVLMNPEKRFELDWQ